MRMRNVYTECRNRMKKLVRSERKRADRELGEKISRDFRGENKKLFWKEVNKLKGKDGKVMKGGVSDVEGNVVYADDQKCTR